MLFLCLVQTHAHTPTHLLSAIGRQQCIQFVVKTKDPETLKEAFCHQWVGSISTTKMSGLLMESNESTSKDMVDPKPQKPDQGFIENGNTVERR